VQDIGDGGLREVSRETKLREFKLAGCVVPDQFAADEKLCALHVRKSHEEREEQLVPLAQNNSLDDALIFNELEKTRTKRNTPDPS